MWFRKSGVRSSTPVGFIIVGYITWWGSSNRPCPFSATRKEHELNGRARGWFNKPRTHPCGYSATVKPLWSKRLGVQPTSHPLYTLTLLLVDLSKVDVIFNWPKPNNVTKVRIFFGATQYWRKFISNFSFITTPLYALTSVKQVFQWGGKQQKSFDILKDKTSTTPILAFPYLVEVFNKKQWNWHPEITFSTHA